MTEIEKLVADLSQKLMARQWKLITAESCTGGGLAYTLTNQAGSSQWFERGLVTYSDQAKVELLRVSPKTLNQFGAVSENIVKEMAEGAINGNVAQFSIAITGIAGPSGDSLEKPVGTVWFGFAALDMQTFSKKYIFKGDRKKIREEAIKVALLEALDYLKV